MTSPAWTAGRTSSTVSTRCSSWSVHWVVSGRLRCLLLNVCACAHVCVQGVVPIINENDAVSANKGYTPSTIFSDNDSLAALVAKETGADVSGRLE